MNNLKLPKNPHKGMAVYCTKCKYSNPKHKDCDHNLKYRVKIHIPGTKNGVRTKVLKSLNYLDAVKEAVEFEQKLIDNNFGQIKAQKTTISLLEAVLMFEKYMLGKHDVKQYQKNVTIKHAKQWTAFAIMFANVLKNRKINIASLNVKNINKYHVSYLYEHLEMMNYSPKYHNKILDANRDMFKFLIKVEDVDMKNPFKNLEKKPEPPVPKETLTEEEFYSIIELVNYENGWHEYVSKGKLKRRNRYKEFLLDGIWLGLMGGARRNEITQFKWKHIMKTVNDNLFLMVEDTKNVVRTGLPKYKYIPITPDLEDYLISKGYPNVEPEDYILFPERTSKEDTIEEDISRGFTHFKNLAKIEKDVKFKHLRKTYLTWLNTVAGKDMVLLSGHKDMDVLVAHYLDERTIKLIDDVAEKFKVFGIKSDNNKNKAG